MTERKAGYSKSRNQYGKAMHDVNINTLFQKRSVSPVFGSTLVENQRDSDRMISNPRACNKVS